MPMSIKSIVASFLLTVLAGFSASAQDEYLDAGNGNPLLPGYFADPSIKKFDDTYYIYATTDGVKLASGEPSVWISEDLVNWYEQEMEMDLPEGLTNCWAPDVLHGKDGRYYYYMGNCQFGCNIYGYVSDTPTGPWSPINNGDPVIPVGTSKEYLPALDAQFLVDDDGSIYSYFGTWCTSFKGMGWVKINSDDMHTIEEEGFIPIEQIPFAFEAAYPIKKDSIYFLMYSAGDCRLDSYAVHYAWSRSPKGPWHYGENNPILETTKDGLIHGPGHHSVLEEDGRHYIVYHRHDNPHSTGGEFRQTCLDEMHFTDPYTIAKVKPTHKGVCFPTSSSIPENLALGAKATASSEYRLTAEANRYTQRDVDYRFTADLACDDNNGTQWKAASAKLPQTLELDLGEQKEIKRIFTEFEYATYFYQYQIETSADGKKWELFADQTANQTPGSPMIDDGEAQARFVRITITGTEKAGAFAAIWNVKVFDETFDLPELNRVPTQVETGSTNTHGLLADFRADKLKTGATTQIKNKGELAGTFRANKPISIAKTDGVQAVQLDGKSYFELSVDAPRSLNWNSPFTCAAWVYVPELKDGICIASWNSRDNMLQSSYAAFMYGSGPYGAVAHGDGAVDLSFKTVPTAGKWHHLVVTFDGMKEQVYVDGKADREMPLMLFVKASKIRIGSSGFDLENFIGSIARVQLYDEPMTGAEIEKLYHETAPKGIKIN